MKQRTPTKHAKTPLKAGMVRSYTVLLRPEPEGGYTVLVPLLPGCITYGRTVAEARAMAEEAISLYLETLHDKHEDIPTEEGSLFSSVTV